jgi:ribonuclease VapC
MVVDSSALLAILFEEAEADKFSLALSRAKIKRISAPSFVEASMAATRVLGAEGRIEVGNLVYRAGIEIVAFDGIMAKSAVEAFSRFGKGQSHPAQLNFGDCMAYAVSKVEDMPLLFKGNDFSLTDVERVI